MLTASTISTPIRVELATRQGAPPCRPLTSASLRFRNSNEDVNGVRTRVDESFVVGAFYLPEGRLDVSIEILKPGAQRLAFDELRIVRSADLDRVSWDDRRS